MKYCPFCGAELQSPDVVFCAECGKQRTQKEKQKKRQPVKRIKTAKQEPVSAKNDTELIEPDAVGDNYDGYYDDVLPPDLDRMKEGMDKALVKKIVILIVAVLAVIGLCVALMYIL